MKAISLLVSTGVLGLALAGCGDTTNRSDFKEADPSGANSAPSTPLSQGNETFNAGIKSFEARRARAFSKPLFTRFVCEDSALQDGLLSFATSDTFEHFVSRLFFSKDLNSSTVLIQIENPYWVSSKSGDYRLLFSAAKMSDENSTRAIYERQTYLAQMIKGQSNWIAAPVGASNDGNSTFDKFFEDHGVSTRRWTADRGIGIVPRAKNYALINLETNKVSENIPSSPDSCTEPVFDSVAHRILLLCTDSEVKKWEVHYQIGKNKWKSTPLSAPAAASDQRYYLGPNSQTWALNVPSDTEAELIDLTSNAKVPFRLNNTQHTLIHYDFSVDAAVPEGVFSLWNPKTKAFEFQIFTLIAADKKTPAHIELTDEINLPTTADDQQLKWVRFENNRLMVQTPTGIQIYRRDLKTWSRLLSDDCRHPQVRLETEEPIP